MTQRNFMNQISLNNGSVVGGQFTTILTSDLPDGTAGQLLIAQGGTGPGFKAMSGDGTITQAGVFTISTAAVTYAKMQNVSAASKLLGRGSAAGAGAPQEITLGTNLSMSGTTLNATGGSGTPGGSVNQVQVNDGASGFHGDSNFTYDFGGSQTLFATIVTGGQINSTGTMSSNGNVTLNSGSVVVGGSSGNVIQWSNGTTAPTPQTLLTLPLNVYGQGTITDLLGDPDAWLLVNKGGTDYKIPAYLP